MAHGIQHQCDLSYAKLCVRQLVRTLRRPLTIEKAESARFCLDVIRQDIEEWIKLNAGKRTSHSSNKS